MDHFLGESEVQDMLKNKDPQKGASFELRTTLSTSEQVAAILIAFLPIKKANSLFDHLEREAKIKIIKAILCFHENEMDIQKSLNNLLDEDLLKLLEATSISEGITLSNDHNPNLSFNYLNETMIRLEELLEPLKQAEALGLLEEVSNESLGHQIVSGLIIKKLKHTTSLIDMDIRVLQLILRKVPYSVLLNAFIGMEDDLKSIVISNVSRRIATTLIEDENSISDLNEEQTQEANEEIKNIIYDLKKKGEIL